MASIGDKYREEALRKARAKLVASGHAYDDPALQSPIDTRRLPPLSDVESILVDRKLHRFMKYYWPMVEPGTNFMDNWHLEAIADHLEAVARGEIKRLIINIPPRCGKSLITGVFFPSWVWANNPDRKWIFASHSQSLATRDSIKMRRLIESPAYKDRYRPDPRWFQGSQEYYPGVVLEKDQNAKSYYQNTATGQRLATSVGSGLTGEGADIIVVDDPHNATEALSSEAARVHAIAWWSGTLSTRLNPGSPVGAKVVIMQRLHENDIVGYILRKRDAYFKALREQIALGIDDFSDTNIDEDDINWDHLCLPAEYMPKHPTPSKTKLNFSDPRAKEGTSIWHAGLPKGKIAALRIELGAYAASGQLDQLPAPAGGGQLRGNWFRKLSRDEWPVKFDESVQSWDLSYSDDPTADFSVGFVLRRKGKQVFLEKRIRGQLSFNDQIAAMKAVYEICPEAKAKYVEKAANARALQNTLATTIPGIILVPATDSKAARAWAWSPYLEAGNIFVPDWEPWVEEFIQECEAFPNGANDDQVDAAGIGILKLIQGARYMPEPDTEGPKKEAWS